MKKARAPSGVRAFLQPADDDLAVSNQPSRITNHESRTTNAQSERFDPGAFAGIVACDFCAWQAAKL
ncbi:hypothetical protein [Marinobacterium rhizophilum]|uniref:Uncharacterized protein n=1 Tax=Marinobacterium rhizophilum TaxID=420402 RepID=A0ABY5HH42_9GAMM|nr:hypothetical protein [Marinobacterium rhizophilum]UTW11686.1 hypothetical protein KDW95_20930 [Marinobacterium rhizophilum]